MNILLLLLPMLSFLVVRIMTIDGCDEIHDLWNENKAFGVLTLNQNEPYCFHYGGSITIFEKSSNINVDVYKFDENIISEVNPIGIAIPIEEGDSNSYSVKITSTAPGTQNIKVANSVDKLSSFSFSGSKIFISTLSNTEYTFSEADDNEVGFIFFRFNDGKATINLSCNFESNQSYIQYKEDGTVTKLYENHSTSFDSNSVYSRIDFYDPFDKNGTASVKYTSNSADWTNTINATLINFNSPKALFAKDFDGLVPEPETETALESEIDESSLHEESNSEYESTSEVEPGKSKRKEILIIGGVIVAVIIVLSLLIATIVACCTWKKRDADSDLKRELLL